MSTDPKTQRLRAIQGKIVDRVGQPIAGALVVLESKDRGLRKETLSDKDGQWSLGRVMALKNEEFAICISAANYLTKTGKISFHTEGIVHFCELNLDPRLTVKGLLVQAEALYLLRDYAGAKKKYEEVITFDLASAMAELGCGLCELGVGNMNEAREHMEKAVTLSRKAPDPKTETAALEYLGDLMVRQLDLDKAMKYFLEAVELEYERTDIIFVKIADICTLQKKPAMALFYYQKALKLNPDLGKDLENKIRNLPGLDDVLGASESAATQQESASPPQNAHATAPNPEYENKLQEILQLAASYCAKMERAAFRYVCLEDVEEENWPGRSFANKNTYRYNFQIVGQKRRVAEKRKLLLENDRKADGATTLQRTIFQSHLKFYAPIDLLGAANQKFYHYKIIREELVAAEPFLVVRIEARSSYDSKLLLEGAALVSPKDGSVLRIEISQDSIEGFAERLQIAREEGFDDVLIRDVHWFEKKDKGLRFPSRSEMREIYLKDQLQTLHYTVSYSYSAYSFFEVQINEIDFR